MNGLIVAAFAILAVASAAPSGHIGGAVVAGPAGVVTSHGAVGAVGHGLGLGLGLAHGGASAVVAGPTASAVVSGPVAGGAILAAPAASAVVAGPALGLGLGVGSGLGLGLGLGHVGALGGGVITNGGGAIGVSAHGAAVRGPGTAPVVVAGPSGKIAAAGLWGPTANIGLGHHGHGW